MSEIFFSTDPDFCPYCKHIPCVCNRLGAPKKQTEPVRVRFLRNAKGSGMTVVERLPLHPQGKEDLLKKMKKSLGCGGTVKEGRLEIQGDKKAPAAQMLEKEGYKVRIL